MENQLGNTGRWGIKVNNTIRILHHWLNHFAKMSHSLYPDPFSRECRCGTNSQNAPCHRVPPHRQRPQSTMRHSFVSVWGTITQRQKVWPFHLNSVHRSSTRAKPISFQLRDACDDSPPSQTVEVHRWNSIKHRPCKIWETPQTY